MLCIVLCLSSCLSEILLAVPANDHSESLSIRAALVARDTPYISVRLSQLSNFTVTDIPQLIIGATVTLLDDENKRLEIPMVEDGRYELKIPDNTYPLQVRPGRAYRLSIITPNGKNYLSAVEPLQPVPIPTSIEDTIVKKNVLTDNDKIVSQEFIRFLLNSPITEPGNGKKTYLKWIFLGTYRFREGNFTTPFPPDVATCYYYEDLHRDKVVTLNSAETRGDSVSNFLLLEETFNYRFAGGFYLSVFQQSLSEAAYQYWKNIGILADQSGDFFDIIPGQIAGNFKNVNDETEQVFGYFYATQEAVLRYYVPPALNRVKPLCPTHTRDPHFTLAICLDCLVQPGSTREKPEFWME